MIRGISCSSVAVRRPDGTIALRVDPIDRIFTGVLRGVILVRGVVALLETLVLGMKSLMYSANVAAGEIGEEISKSALIAVLSLSFTFGVSLFFVLPVLASKFFENITQSSVVGNITEGVIRLAVFFAYLLLIGKMRQINRVFMYHGAEHMTVHAQENCDALEVGSIRSYPTAHPRCGTAFLLTVLIVASIVFSFIDRDVLWVLVLSRLVLIPPIAAISYELIRFGGFNLENPIVKLVTMPSLVIQSLTTRQPSDDQIEIAITAMEAAIKYDSCQAT